MVRDGRALKRILCTDNNRRFLFIKLQCAASEPKTKTLLRLSLLATLHVDLLRIARSFVASGTLQSERMEHRPFPRKGRRTAACCATPIRPIRPLTSSRRGRNAPLLTHAQRDLRSRCASRIADQAMRRVWDRAPFAIQRRGGTPWQRRRCAKLHGACMTTPATWGLAEMQGS